MNDMEMRIGRIQAVLYASEEVVKRAERTGDRGTVIMAKETAYDRIKGIMEDPSYCPWQE